MTRDEILEAAVLIFSQKGYHATSMQDIAQAVNLKKASLYHHFSCKQEMLVELLDQALDMLIVRIQAVIDQPTPEYEKLRSAMMVYLTTLLDNRDRAAVLLLEYRSLESDYYNRHLPRRDKFERIWRDLIHRGANQGVFNCEDPAIAARALLGMMNWSITWYRQDGKLSAEEIAQNISDLFLKGLLTRQDSHKP